jgi:hypothetical protein
MTAKSESIKREGRRFGGCVSKAVGLTPGGLRRDLETGGGAARRIINGAGVSRGHSRPVKSDQSIEALARKGRNGGTRRSGNYRKKARTMGGDE